MSDDLRIFRRDRVVGQALRASLVSGNTTRPIRIDQNMPDQTVTFIRTAYQLAVERQRIADARAERQHREAIQSNARSKQAGVNHQRIDIVVNSGRQSGRLTNHDGKFHGCDQCMNGANVTTVPSTICPPSEIPTAHGFGQPAISASSEQSVVSCLISATTVCGEASSISRSWHPVMICPIALTATAEICVALIFMPTKDRAFAITCNPVCGRPRRSVFSFLHETFRQFAGLAGRHRRLLNHAPHKSDRW